MLSAERGQRSGSGRGAVTERIAALHRYRPTPEVIAAIGQESRVPVCRREAPVSGRSAPVAACEPRRGMARPQDQGRARRSGRPTELIEVWRPAAARRSRASAWRASAGAAPAGRSRGRRSAPRRRRGGGRCGRSGCVPERRARRPRIRGASRRTASGRRATAGERADAASGVGDRAGRRAASDRAGTSEEGPRGDRDRDPADAATSRRRGARRRDRADPNSPFAKLAALKEQLEAKQGAR